MFRSFNNYAFNANVIKDKLAELVIITHKLRNGRKNENLILDPTRFYLISD